MVVTDVAKHRSKDHHGDQDGVGDGEYQHKGKTDDAELFGLLQFVLLLLAESLSGGTGKGSVWYVVAVKQSLALSRKTTRGREFLSTALLVPI